MQRLLVRVATETDIVHLFKHVPEWFSYSGAGIINREYFEGRVRLMMKTGLMGLFALIHNDEPVGCIAGICGPSLYNGDMEAHQIGWYILPKYRNTENCLALINEFEDWSTKVGCVRFYNGHRMTSDQRIGDMLVKHGYTPYSVTYRKEVLA